MNIRIVLSLLVLPMAALAQPADSPRAEHNPATNRYAPLQGFFKMPAGRAMGASSAVTGDSKGNIWVVDRCAANTCIGSNLAPVMEFDRNGNFIKAWGAPGSGPGQFGIPHCLAMDSKGRLYVGDRDNNRIQVFTQDGKFLGQFTQFGRPSGIVIDRNDKLYVTDSESRAKDGYGHHPGWKRGVRIGSVKDGVVTDFIPDTWPDPENSSTSGGEGIWADGKGAVYSAQVGQKEVVKYERN